MRPTRGQETVRLAHAAALVWALAAGALVGAAAALGMDHRCANASGSKAAH